MKRNWFVIPAILIALALPLSACIGLIPLEGEEEVAGGYGPQITAQEHQRQTLDRLWALFQEEYIYYESAAVDWEGLRGQYQQSVESGLSAAQFDDLLRGLEADLPPESLLYQSRAERIETDIVDNTTYEGIGAFVGFDAEPEPHIVLLSIIEGSPADAAGLQAHDSIYAIDGDPVLLEEGVQAVQRVRGPSGTSVVLTVQSPGGDRREVRVQRGKLERLVRLEVSRIADTNFGYLLFPPIPYEAMLEDVLTSLRALTEDQALDGLILDLRVAGSPGGWPLESLYTVFHNGEIGEFYSRTDRQVLEVRGQDIFGSQSVPLIVLVGRNTQGFPEILAGSLQAQGRALVVGDLTGGSVERPSAYILPDGSRVYLETVSFVLPNGAEIGLDGVRPDVRVEAGWDDVLPGRDPVLDAAILQFRTDE